MILNLIIINIQLSAFLIFCLIFENKIIPLRIDSSFYFSASFLFTFSNTHHQTRPPRPRSRRLAKPFNKINAEK
ncbi:hypothetical protein BC937DRAFT_86450 [Endogone sp. FLAS-F59071]|nr:hypothetical protein BC937DRAFT_86450 [Endogone sp. FLAS-F59071]|eukprot:RUS13035.1 hypothetical protein BC937DRAFT_86450 [Endogone sp. FLAS-F59071]